MAAAQRFRVVSEFEPAGDQPRAIEGSAEAIEGARAARALGHAVSP